MSKLGFSIFCGCRNILCTDLKRLLEHFFESGSGKRVEMSFHDDRRFCCKCWRLSSLTFCRAEKNKKQIKMIIHFLQSLSFQCITAMQIKIHTAMQCTKTWKRRRFLNRVQVENFSSSKLEVNKFIPIKFATYKFSTWTWFKNRPLDSNLRSADLKWYVNDHCTAGTETMTRKYRNSCGWRNHSRNHSYLPKVYKYVFMYAITPLLTIAPYTLSRTQIFLARYVDVAEDTNVSITAEVPWRSVRGVNVFFRQNRRPWVRISPRSRLFRTLYIALLLDVT
jgi:hypothetical protein